MNADPLTPAVRLALRLWYLSQWQDRRIERWYDCGQAPLFVDDDSQVKWSSARYRLWCTLSEAERAAYMNARRRMAERLGWLS